MARALDNDGIEDMQFVITVTGNCGREHSYEAWRNCPTCAAPKPADHRWWADGQDMQFVKVDGPYGRFSE